MPQHAAMIAVLLRERPTCVRCVASKSRLTAVEVERYLTTIATALVVVRFEDERCRVCGDVGGAYTVRQSSESEPDRRVIRGGSTADDDLRPRARLLVDVREVPSIAAKDNVDQIPCGLLCGRPFVRGRSWYEIRFSGRSFWLDGDCFAIWRDEMERAKRPSTYSASNG